MLEELKGLLFSVCVYIYQSLLCTEIAPRLTNNFCELSFSIWVERFELIVLFSKEKVVTTSIGFWVAGVPCSSASSPPTRAASFTVASVWNKGITILSNRKR